MIVGDNKIHYEYFGPGGQRATRTLTPNTAALRVGERVLLGFEVVCRFLTDRNGDRYQITYFQSAISGRVWALYY
jgi:hypothetical protein